ncbi:MAG: DnaA ATPase domain-containing protein, partial [Mycobacteriales bacterium]
MTDLPGEGAAARAVPTDATAGASPDGAAADQGGATPVAHPGSVELGAAWRRAIAGLTEDALTGADRAWLRLTRPVALVEGTALLAAPNDFTKELLDTRLRPALATALAAELGHDVQVAVTVEALPSGAATADEEEDETGPDPDPLHLAPQHHMPGTGRGAPTAADPARLNPKYVFETFVIGSSNRFAHAAAVAVAEAPAKAYNPLFIYGDSGLGKTHLLHAIGHYAQHLFPRSRVRYVSS